jgi:hypothetical protein
MSDFLLWFQLGLNHITDLQGYDHMLFLIITSCVFVLRDIRKVLILITGFTLGHSITLALSTLNMISLNTNLIELCIAITIFITAAYQIIRLKSKNNNVSLKFEFAIISLFGLIHGLGFSNMLKSLLGTEENIILPLFYFNLGIEAGQILIVCLILTMSTLIINKLKLNRIIYIAILSVIVLIISGNMIKHRFRIWTKPDNKTTQIPQKESTFVIPTVKIKIENISHA